jgi:hypothetical protein
LMSLIDPNDLRRCVTRYQGDYRVRQFSCWHQFLCMSFGQLTHRESLRDIITCLGAHECKLYHIGLSRGVSRSTLADANEQRDVSPRPTPSCPSRLQTLPLRLRLSLPDFQS